MSNLKAELKDTLKKSFTPRKIGSALILGLIYSGMILIAMMLGFEFDSSPWYLNLLVYCGCYFIADTIYELLPSAWMLREKKPWEP